MFVSYQVPSVHIKNWVCLYLAFTVFRLSYWEVWELCGTEYGLLISHFQLSLLMSQTGLSHCYVRNFTVISLILLFLILFVGPSFWKLTERVIIFPKRVFLSRTSDETWSVLTELTSNLCIWLVKLQILLFLWISSYNAGIVNLLGFQT